MEKKFWLAMAVAAGLVLAGRPARRDADATLAYKQKLSEEQQALLVLDRFTFGPRPGDVEAVRRLGWQKWFNQQLHADGIGENPVLVERLRPLTSLTLSNQEIAAQYPSPQVVVAMATGRLPLPQDPERRALYQSLAERYRLRIAKKNGEAGNLTKPPKKDDAEAEGDREEIKQKLAAILTADQRQALLQGSAEEKTALVQSLPPATVQELFTALPGPAKGKLLSALPTDQRRQMLRQVAPQQVLAQDLAEAKIYRAVYSERQLAEVLDDFWYNHFNVYLDKGADKYLVTSYEQQAIRPHVLGKFQDLLKATAESPAMLFYLDNWQSVDPNSAVPMGRFRPNPKNKKKTSRGLNENYGRELLELHTLGVDGGYTQQDVKEVARCFTGWTIRDPQRGGEFWYNDRVHDRGEKTVLGVKIPAGGGQEDGLKVLEIVSRHPSTAKFISRQLAQRFVADNPPDSLVAAMAATFRKTDGDLRAVLQTMVNAPEFFAPGTLRAKVKSPLEMVVSAARATDADVTSALGLAQQIANLGQPLYRKQEPTGYSNSSEEWVSSSALLSRMNFALALTSNKLPGVKVDPQRLPVDLPPAQVARAMLFRDASGATLQSIEKGLAALPEAERRSPAVLAGLVLGSPEFQRR